LLGSLLLSCLLLALTAERAQGTLSRPGDRVVATDTVALNRELAQLRVALETTDPAQQPRAWGQLQCDLGSALLRLGRLNRDAELLRAALDAHRAAAAALRDDATAVEWATLQDDLARSYSALGVVEGGGAHWQAAIAANRRALEVWTREREPERWVEAMDRLAFALHGRGQREAGIANLRSAVQTWRLTQQVWTRQGDPGRWAAVQLAIANTLYQIGQRRPHGPQMEQAAAAYRQIVAMPAGDEGIEGYRRTAHRNLRAAEAQIARRDAARRART